MIRESFANVFNEVCKGGFLHIWTVFLVLLNIIKYIDAEWSLS